MQPDSVQSTQEIQTPIQGIANPIAETTPRPSYPSEVPTGTVAPSIPGSEVISQPQAPVEDFSKITTSPLLEQPAVNNSPQQYAQYPTQAPEMPNANLTDPRSAQAEAAFAIPNEQIKLTPQEFPTPAPNPEPVVAGADTTNPEFPGGPQENLSPEPSSQTSKPQQTESSQIVDAESEKELTVEEMREILKGYDPVVQQKAINAFNLYFAFKKLSQGDEGASHSSTEALTDELKNVTHLVNSIPGKEEVSEVNKPA